MPHLEPQERVDNFKEIQKGFNEEMAIREGKRCIICGASCLQACPYDVMPFNHEVLKAVKCYLCIDKRGGEEAPACTSICPSQCILVGDQAAFPSGSKIVV